MAMREVSQPVEVRVVLLLDQVHPLGWVAWQAIREAGAVYQVDDRWIEIRLAGENDLRVVPRIEATHLGREPLPDVRSALPPDQVDDLLVRTVWTSPAPAVKESYRLEKGAYGSAARGYAARSPGNAVADQRALVALVRDALRLSSGTVVVVHDRPIQPPPGLRYVIWDPAPGGVAVSFATLDPGYWGERVDEDTRLVTIRRRLRAALCSVLGTAIGLVRCDNPTCFLFANVDRVARLDHMVRIGEEHDAPALTGRGFTPDDDRLDAVADVVQVDDAEYL